MASTPKIFKGGIFAFGNLYYIHYHQQNIGYADGRNTAPNITSIFKSQKDDAYWQSLHAYKSLFQANLSNASGILLSEIFNTETLAQIDNELRKRIQTNIENNMGTLSSLMEKQRSIFNGKKAFINTFQQAGQQIKSFDNLLETLAEAVELVQSPLGGQLASAIRLAQTQTGGAQNVKTMGIQLQNALNNFLRPAEGQIVTDQQMVKAVETINNLAKAMTSKETKSGTTLTKANLTKLIDAIFNTGLAEGCLGIAATLATNAVDDSIVSLTGQDTHSLFTFKKGEGWTERDNGLGEGKADSIQKNYKMSFDYQGGKNNASITFNLGLSDKWYRTQHFGNLDNKTVLDFSTGSGGLTLGEVINELFGTNTYNSYLGFNIMAHRGERNNEAKELQNLIMTRYLTNFISSRGGAKDFAQYIIANGEVVSVLELILYSKDHFLGQSNSQGKQVINISIPDHTRITNAANITFQKRRTQEVNHLINKAGMTAHIHIDKIKHARAAAGY